MVGAGFNVEVFNVLGAGDAFMSGFLRGWLRDLPLEQCCELANAAGAIVVSRHGCAPAMPTWIEMQAFLADRDRPFRLREDADLEHIHWATTRAGIYDQLSVLAIDHRSQFEDLVRELGADPAAMSSFQDPGPERRSIRWPAGIRRSASCSTAGLGFDALAAATGPSLLDRPANRGGPEVAAPGVPSVRRTWRPRSPAGR